jgi:DNA-binding transcriptional LysR family regulator
MSLSRYEIFHSVVELGSLTKAAEFLNLTQSGVSHAIASLETELGFSLLTRDRAGVRLTTNGEIILNYVRDTLQCNDRLRQKVAEINGIQIGTVRIGTFTSVSSQWLPGIIQTFRSLYPMIEIKLFEGDYDDINRWIANGTVDFGFVSLPVIQAFEFIPLKKDKLVCVLPQEHFLRHQSEITFAQIEKEAFIMPKWGTHGDVRRILVENNLKLDIRYEVVEDQAIVAMVKRGLGISILPEMVLRHNMDDIQIVNLERATYRTIGIALMAMSKASPAAKKVLNCVKKWLDSEKLLDF